jgi:hypothetical protein
MAQRPREENQAHTEHREGDADDIERVVAPQFREIERNDRGCDRKSSNAPASGYLIYGADTPQRVMTRKCGWFSEMLFARNFNKPVMPTC